MSKFLEVLTDGTIYFAVFIALIYLIGFTRNSRAYKTFTCYLIAMSGIGLAMHILKDFYGVQNNLYFFVYFLFSQFILLSLFHYYLLKLKWIKYVLIGISLLLVVQYMMTPKLYFQYNPLGIFVTQSILLLYGILFLYRSLNEKLPFQIANIGLLLFLAMSTLIFVSGNLVFDLSIPDDFIRLLRHMNSVVYSIFQILLFVEWWKNYRGALFNRK
ncbi:MAG: hypothetical protein KTR22_09100 [Flavobacteriaceae bacterium]|nr:hypothetical protein [Flavobacteriaceae bacterium]